MPMVAALRAASPEMAEMEVKTRDMRPAMQSDYIYRNVSV
jgi:hypothetical protein